MIEISNIIIKSKRLVFWVLLFLCNSALLFSQKENHTWITGYQYLNKKINAVDTGVFKLYGGNIFNFNKTPTEIARISNSLSIHGLNINFCDRFGNLLFYSNGSKIFNYEHKLIENADSLNYSLSWKNALDSGYYALHSNALWNQSMLAFRNPSNLNQYYLVSLFLNWGVLAPDLRAFTKLQYSILDMSLNNGKGKLIVKEKLIDSGNYGNGVFACKKANGKDWWIFARDMNKSNCFHKMSLDGNGIRLETEKECIGYTMWSKDNDTMPNAHFGNFSPDGKRFVFLSLYGLEVFDFDRCTGKFSNRKFKNHPFNDSLKNLGLYGPTYTIFSPNSAFLYVMSPTRIYQYDLSVSDIFSSQTTVAYYDGFKDHLNEDTFYVGFPTTFYHSQIAPDGRIYIANNTRYITYIDSPNKKGLASNVKQHVLKLQSYQGGPPYHPNYDLGAMDCCLGGINNNLARTDTTLNSRDTGGKYQWLYCDSNFKPIPNAQSDIFKPLYTGVYALKINKGICVDTTDCYLFDVHRSGINEVSNDEFSIYPNPAKNSTRILFSEIHTGETLILITDVMGRLVGSEQLNLNSNIYELNTSNFNTGIYFIHIKTNNQNLKNSKLRIEK